MSTCVSTRVCSLCGVPWALLAPNSRSCLCHPAASRCLEKERKKSKKERADIQTNSPDLRHEEGVALLSRAPSMETLEEGRESARVMSAVKERVREESCLGCVPGGVGGDENGKV